MEEGTMSQGAGWPLEAAEARKGLSPRASKRTWFCQHLDFSPVRPISDFGPPERQNNKFVLFEATEFVAICYNINRK